MLDLTIYKSRYYDVKTNDNEVIHLEIPKKKQLKSLVSLTKNLNSKELNENDIDTLYEASLIAFNKNKEGKVFTEEEIEDILPINSLYAFFNGYYSWVAENINQKN